MTSDLQDKSVKRKPLHLITCDAQLADRAYTVYAAMRRAETAHPELLEIPLWNVYRAGAYEMFARAFELI